nr:hypothetical protein [Angustibacter aerolatus]
MLPEWARRLVQALTGVEPTNLDPRAAAALARRARRAAAEVDDALGPAVEPGRPAQRRPRRSGRPRREPPRVGAATRAGSRRAAAQHPPADGRRARAGSPSPRGTRR